MHFITSVTFVTFVTFPRNPSRILVEAKSNKSLIQDPKRTPTKVIAILVILVILVIPSNS